MACKNCEVYQRTEDSLQARLIVQKQRADLLERILDKEQSKPPIKELLETASAAAQIAKLSINAFPEGGPVADAAAAVALGALKQIRERVRGGAECAS